MKIISSFKDYYDHLVGKYGMDELLVYARHETIDTDLPIKKSPIQTPTTLMDITNPSDYVVHHILYIGDHCIPIFASQHKIYTLFDLADVNQLDHIEHRAGEWRVIYQQRNPKNIRLNFLDGRAYFLVSPYIGLGDIANDIISRHGLQNRSSTPLFRQIFANNSYKDSKRYPSWHLIPIDHKPSVNHDALAHYLHTPIILQQLICHQNTLAQINHLNPNLSNLGIFIEPNFIWQALVEFLSRLRTEREISPPLDNHAKIISKGFDPKTAFRPKMRQKS